MVPPSDGAETPIDQRELNFCGADLGEDGSMVLYGMGFEGGGRSRIFTGVKAHFFAD